MGAVEAEMIIWINGAFGVGKSLIAEELNKRIDNSFIYDPEQVGYFLWDHFPDDMKRRGDFQDIEMWRDFNYQMIKYIQDHDSGTLIVPMTLVNKDYFDEIVTRLIGNGIDVRHFILTAEKDVIIKRLKDRSGDHRWAEQQIDKCLQAFDRDITETKIGTDSKTPDEIALEIAAKCNIVLD